MVQCSSILEYFSLIKALIHCLYSAMSLPGEFEREFAQVLYELTEAKKTLGISNFGLSVINYFKVLKY